jgi:hypothetical protein
MPPEYLLLFSGEGPIRVRVRFKDFKGHVAESALYADELEKLVSPHTGGFITKMTFDEWPFEVYKYEIDPIKNVLTIRVRPMSE